MIQINLAKFLLSKENKIGGGAEQKHLRVTDYERVAKTSKITLPAGTTHVINTADIRSSVTQMAMQLSTVQMLPFSLIYSKPRKQDRNFQNAFRESLNQDDTVTPDTEKLVLNLRKVRSIWDLSNNVTRAYLLTAAGTDPTLKRLMTESTATSFEIFMQLLKDYDRTSSDNAITLKQRLFGIELKSSMTLSDLISQIETIESDIRAAGGSIDTNETALLALNKAKGDERFKTEVAAHIAAQERERIQATWADTKTLLLKLDRSKPAPGTETTTEKIMKTTIEDKKSGHRDRYCKTCHKRHPHGEHVDKNKRGRNRYEDKRNSSGGRHEDNSRSGSVQEVAEKLIAAVFHLGNTKGGRGFGNRGRGGGGRSAGRGRGFEGYCNHCGKWGHTAARCFSNPANQEGGAPRKTGYHPRESEDQANYVADYEEALSRVQRARYDAYVLYFGSEPVAAHLSVFEKDKFLAVYDTAATRFFIWASKHSNIGGKVHIPRDVSTANSGKLKSIYEGFIGFSECFGMSDELSVQLLGGKVLAKLGYEVTISSAGAKFYNPCTIMTKEKVGPFMAPWKNDLIYVDIRNFPEFWIGKFRHIYQPKIIGEAAMVSEVTDNCADIQLF